MAIYKYDKKNIEFAHKILKENQNIINTIHLNSQNCILLYPNKDFSYFKDNIIKEIEIGNKYGIKRFVLHMNRYKLNTIHHSERFFDLIIPLLEELEIELKKKDSEIFIENLYEPLSFYQELFKRIHEKRLNRIHYTFDFGHAKCWSGDNIEEWFEYLRILKNKYNRKFHFHVHTNNGLFDEHKSFLQGNNTNRNDIDGKYLISNRIEQYVIDFIKEFNEDTFVMEMEIEEQIKNWKYLKSYNQ